MARRWLHRHQDAPQDRRTIVVRRAVRWSRHGRRAAGRCRPGGGDVTVTLAPDIDRAAWLEARRKGIGASEIAAVLGISPWESPFSLYWRKVNGWDYEPSSEMEWGTRLEPVIAEKYANNHAGVYDIESGELR